jgi:hypothetical protein
MLNFLAKPFLQRSHEFLSSHDSQFQAQFWHDLAALSKKVAPVQLMQSPLYPILKGV